MTDTGIGVVTWPVATALLRQLAGFRGYPKEGPGEDYFIQAICDHSISVDHAIAIVRAFDGDFPRLAEIRDTAYNLRPRFERVKDERREWERLYGKPDPNWTRTLTGNYTQQKARMLWQRIRDIVYYTEGPGRNEKHDVKFWTQAALRLRRDHPAELQKFRENDLPMGWEELMKSDWVREMEAEPVPVPANAITQADIDREEAKHRDVKALASGEDTEDRWE